MIDLDFESHRSRLFAIAYRMLGSAMDADDMVQEAWLRYQQVDAAAIQSPQAYLTTIVTRLCLNQLTSARAQRESYIGPWLPEPILTSSDTLFYTPAHHVNQYESISVAFLFLLERLSPAERAVFLLREVFDYAYDEIAAILDKSEVACRQLCSRAKQHLTAHRPRFESSSSQHDHLIHHFFQAIEGGDLEGLTRLLAEDVVVWTDGGGKVVAALHPICGRDLAARFMLNSKQLAPGPFVGEMASVNGRSAIILRNQEGGIFLVVNVETDETLIRTVHIVGNPDKLHYLSYQ